MQPGPEQFLVGVKLLIEKGLSNARYHCNLGAAIHNIHTCAFLHLGGDVNWLLHPHGDD